MVTLNRFESRVVVPIATLAVLSCGLVAPNGFARDPVTYLGELAEESEAIVLARVLKTERSSEFADLDARDFDEYSVEMTILGAFKGQLKRGDKAVVIAYRPTGRGAPGNFGSALRLFGKDKRTLHLLYLRRRESTWMPTTGYVDGGNSHFLVSPSGYVE